MSTVIEIDRKQEREKDTKKILDSTHAKKVVVAGPGTGKSFLFQEAIRKAKEQGGTNFLALTFMGKLCDELADDLAGLAETRTLHSFAREVFLKNCPKNDGWEYCQNIKVIIEEDLNLSGIEDYKIGDNNYLKRTKLYRAVGNDDIVYYATQICKNNANKIPEYDLVLVDEYQDLNEIEAEFIDLLAEKNKILVVGDDDQALYGFKGSFSKFIREKYNESNTDYESHTLKYCSRCTNVIIDSFHNIVDHFDLNNEKSERVKKEYSCYIPDKKTDSDLNPKLIVMKDVPDGMLAYKITSELKDILKNQKIKSVLVVGEGQTCKSTLAMIASLLSESGFEDVNFDGNQKSVYSLKENMITGYKILSKEKNEFLAWRLLVNDLNDEDRKKIILENFEDKEGFIGSIPDDFKKIHVKNSKTLKNITSKPKSQRELIADSSIAILTESIVISKKDDKSILFDQLIKDSNTHTRPLKNLNIILCNILKSKGLGADVVFLIGFDQGRLPKKVDVEEAEIYQLLVALTRAKKRIYLINTTGKRISSFLDCINKENYEEI
jgi:superfamily I DNA/RNA helicase